MAETLWYYAIENEQFGPVTFAELRQLVSDGKLAADDLLWREGMDAWTPASHLRALFENDSPGEARPVTATSLTDSDREPPPMAPAVPTPPAPLSNDPLAGTLRAVQLSLWTVCVLVVLVGTVLFTRAFLTANEPGEEVAAGAVYSTFFVAAYVLARSSEKLARLLVQPRIRASGPSHRR